MLERVWYGIRREERARLVGGSHAIIYVRLLVRGCARKNNAEGTYNLYEVIVLP